MLGIGNNQPQLPRQHLEFAGPGYKMSALDWRSAAFRLRCEPAVIRAVAEQEAGGPTGFLPDKRPIILFEARWFGQFTRHRYDHTHPNLSTTVWDRTLYRGGAAEYERLGAAIRLDRVSALRATSWGMFQIMGFNCREVGYEDVEQYAAAMCYSEGKQLQAFVSFVMRNGGMTRAIRRLDWAGFAQLYNGDGYRVNHYDTRMARHYHRFRSDTSYLVGVPQQPRGDDP